MCIGDLGCSLTTTHQTQVIKTFEADHTQSPNVSASKKSWGLGMAVGHYSFANVRVHARTHPGIACVFHAKPTNHHIQTYIHTPQWLECDVSLPEPRFFRPECYEKSIHTSPGVFGYYVRTRFFLWVASS